MIKPELDHRRRARSTGVKPRARDPWGRDVESIVLIVDDEETVLDIFSRGLSEHGYSTITAPTAEEALDKVRDKTINYSLIDIRLPEMSGIGLCQELKKRFPNIVNILMTGYPSIKTAVEALRKHAYDYLIKPFRLEQVLSVIERSKQDLQLSCENSYMAETIRALKAENERLKSIIEEFIPDEAKLRARSFRKNRGFSYKGLSAVRSYEQHLIDRKRDRSGESQEDRKR